VLKVMKNLKIITLNQYQSSLKRKLHVPSSLRAGQREYPAFIELVKKQLREEYRLKTLQHEGLRIYTTLDPWLQKIAEKSVISHLKTHALSKNLEAAVVLTSVDGGEVRALIGSKNVKFFGFNRALNAKRSIGSLVKPAVYLAALKTGRFHWNTVVSDNAVEVKGPNGKIWSPENYNHLSGGKMIMLEGLVNSLNQLTVRLGMQVGLDEVAKTLQALGVREKIPPYPSILLGSISLSPFQVAHMYQTMASGGFEMKPKSIMAVTTNQGDILSSYAVRGRQVFKAKQIELLRYGMKEVSVRGTAKTLSSLFPHKHIASKTGTTNQQRDAWYAGFDDKYLGVVWVGRDNNGKTNQFGATGAMPIMANIWKEIGVQSLSPLAHIPYYYANERGHISQQSCLDYVQYIPVLGTPKLESCPSVDIEHNTDENINKKVKKVKSWLDWLF
jgi:penicillin-binding protein 1B